MLTNALFPAERRRSVARRPAVVDPVRELRRVGGTSGTGETGLTASPVTGGIRIVGILEEQAARRIADDDPLESAPPERLAVHIVFQCPGWPVAGIVRRIRIRRSVCKAVAACASNTAEKPGHRAEVGPVRRKHPECVRS